MQRDNHTEKDKTSSLIECIEYTHPKWNGPLIVRANSKFNPVKSGYLLEGDASLLESKPKFLTREEVKSLKEF